MCGLLHVQVLAEAVDKTFEESAGGAMYLTFEDFGAVRTCARWLSGRCLLERAVRAGC